MTCLKCGQEILPSQKYVGYKVYDGYYFFHRRYQLDCWYFWSNEQMRVS